MNIALLSLPMTWNYGGILQQFALQEVLRGLGHNTHIICRRQHRTNKLVQYAVSAKWVLVPMLGKTGIFKHLPLLATEPFKIKQLINHSRPLFNNQELLSYLDDNEIDGVVVGSDQVWNKWAVPDLYNYYLDFCEAKLGLRRVAYAASFSKPEWDYTEIERLECGRLLKKFDAISTRETVGVEHCKTRFGVDVDFLPDPTLLLSKDQYLKVAAEANSVSKAGGVFSYILDADINKKSFVKSVCQNLGSPLMSFPAEENVGFFSGFRKSVSYSVEDWLLGIANAEFVVTDSYHGMVFAILFNKPFYAFPNKLRGTERFNSLTGKLGLESRLIIDQDLKCIDLDQPINWGSVNSKLDEWKLEAMQFLQRGLA